MSINKKAFERWRPYALGCLDVEIVKYMKKDDRRIVDFHRACMRVDDHISSIILAGRNKKNRD